MLEQEPSRTAFAAAAHRAAHQVLDQGRIFADPLALPILGVTADEITRGAAEGPRRSAMRFFIAARARFAESHLADAMERRGVRQLVVLGAGLDTFAYRSPLASQLQIFEVDHPATQAWKRRRLAEAGIAIPGGLVFAPVNFERESFVKVLEASGLASDQRTFFIWLGVVPYLTRETIFATLKAIGALPGGAEVVFDYSDPPHTLSPELRALHAERAARVAALGEPFLSQFEPPELHAQLAGFDLSAIEDLGPRAIIEQFVPPEARAQRAAAGGDLPERGGHILHAMTAWKEV
ncbi:MAG: SAM-dependent methyltransferase [Alphaproteobacteria bacterium]|nr:SAM-dependent methyltransferase [Alphaproteobacteria bacterium]